jgi:small-conductance mechanosensitive channel
MGILRFGAILLLLMAILAALPSRGKAADENHDQASEIVLPEHLTKPEVRDLISRLSDDQVRELLIRQLDQLAAGEADSGVTASLDGSFEQGLRDLYRRLDVIWSGILEVPSVGAFLIKKLTAERAPSYVWVVLLFLAVIFSGAGIVEWLFRRLFIRFSQLAHGGEVRTTLDRVCFAGLHMLTELLAIGVFAIASIVIFLAVFADHEPGLTVILAVFWIVIPVRVIAAVAGALLSPHDPDTRLLPLDDQTAQWGFRRIVAVGTIIVFVRQLIGLLIAYQVPEEPQLAVRAISLFAVLGFILLLIWRDRNIVATMILSGDSHETVTKSPAKEFLASNWHVLASFYISGLFLFGWVGVLVTGERYGNPVIISLCLLPAVPIIDWLARIGIRHFCDSSQQDQSEDPSSTETTAVETPTGLDAGVVEKEHGPKSRSGGTRQSFEPVLIRNIRIIVGLLVIVLLAKVWGWDLHNFTAESISERVADALFEIVIMLVFVSAIWGFVKTAISYYAPHEGIDVSQMVEGDAAGTGLSRAQTLLPLFRKFIFITLIVIVTLIILSSLGVSIGPLIAGAGVVGLAIGFGAQTLVKDIISGAFFLADDAFRLGEYIDVGIAKGMVEKISVRSFRLRHHNGPINTIPFGEVQKVMNYSRDWVIMKLEMRVPSDTDLEKLRKIVKKVGQAMMDDPVHGPNFLQPVKSQGVNRMDDDGAFLIRVKFMCKPGEQFVLRREVFRRVQEALAENGIKFAPKRVLVDTQLGSTDSQTVAAALAVEKSGKAEPQPDAL